MQSWKLVMSIMVTRSKPDNKLIEIDTFLVCIIKLTKSGHNEPCDSTVLPQIAEDILQH